MELLGRIDLEAENRCFRAPDGQWYELTERPDLS
jgi:hypothetical protein